MNLYQPTITGSLSVSGSVNISGSISIAGGGTISGTASIATTALTASSADNLLVRNTLTAQTLVVQTITSSVDFVTGSTRFGSILGNTHQFTGSVSMTGSLAVVTTGTELQVNASGVNIGNALTDSHIISGSVRINPNGLFVSSSGLSIFGGTSTTSANPTVVMQNRLGTVLSVAGFNWAGTTTDNNSVNSLMILGGYLNTSAQTVATATTAAGMQFYDGGFYWYGNTGLTPGSVYTNTQRMFLTSGGNLIIGSGGDGGFRLDVSGTARITGAATFSSTISTPSFISSDTEFRLGAAFARVATLDAGGGFGGGYNLNWNNGSPIHNSTGTISGYGYANDGSVRFYANVSSAANTAALLRLSIGSDGSIAMGNFSPSGTPTADYRSFEIGRQGNTIAGAPWKSSLYLTTNATITAGSTAFTYRNSGVVASFFGLEGGEMSFSNASSGTAGNTVSFIERMRITSGGVVNIGLTSGINLGERFNVIAYSLSSPTLSRFYVNVSGALSTSAARFDKFDNNSTTSQVFIDFTINNQNTANGSITANGANQATFTSWSDRRLKENITNLPSQLSNIMALRPVEFDYKDGSGHQIGFIAQEVQEVYSDIVGENAEGYLTISGLGKMESRLIKAIQELKAEFDEYKATHP